MSDRLQEIRALGKAWQYNPQGYVMHISDDARVTLSLVWQEKRVITCEVARPWVVAKAANRRSMLCSFAIRGYGDGVPGNEGYELCDVHSVDETRWDRAVADA